MAMVMRCAIFRSSNTALLLIARLFVVGVVVDQDAGRSTVEILILAVFQRPQKHREREQAEAERDRDQGQQRAQRLIRRKDRPSVSALAITRIEEADMDTAAIKGVAKPRTAIGTAITL